jgi:hypothetical protein
MLPSMTGFWFAWSRFYPTASLFGAIGEFSEETPGEDSELANEKADSA